MSESETQEKITNSSYTFTAATIPFADQSESRTSENVRITPLDFHRCHNECTEPLRHPFASLNKIEAMRVCYHGGLAHDDLKANSQYWRTAVHAVLKKSKIPIDELFLPHIVAFTGGQNPVSASFCALHESQS